jgi:DNA-binding transcriptional regulator YiaG
MKKSLHRFDDAGLRNVWLVNGYKVVKTPYGSGVSYRDIDGLTRTICAALVRNAGRLTGVEFRYLRLHLRLSQAALARLLGNTEQSVANWEKTGRVPLWADKHIRILWQAAEDGNETVKRVVARLNEVERLAKQRIVVEETSHGWRSRIKPVTV